MLSKLFQNLGLTDKEAKVYLASLEIGTNPVSEIGKKAKINRVTTYDILEKLIKKGLVNYIIRRNIKYFSATDPELVAVEYKRRAEELHHALPELKRLHGETAHPKVQYFEGLEGIKRVFADCLQTMTPDEEDGNQDTATDGSGEAATNGSEKTARVPVEILNYTNGKDLRSIWPAMDDEYSNPRITRGINLKCLCTDDEVGRVLQAQDRDRCRETRLIAADKFSIHSEILIYGNRTAIISFKGEPLAVLIENQEIADTQRNLFNIAWTFAAFKEPAFPIINSSSSNRTAQGLGVTNDTGLTAGMTIRKVSPQKNREEKTSDESQASLF